MALLKNIAAANSLLERRLPHTFVKKTSKNTFIAKFSAYVLNFPPACFQLPLLFIRHLKNLESRLGKGWGESLGLEHLRILTRIADGILFFSTSEKSATYTDSLFAIASLILFGAAEESLEEFRKFQIIA
ncbi:MAG: hypothetical protein HC890_08035 [Chloroflexaceae bacterium]|nr:hypothetical protein [Chloroflexaceae bacterium]